MSEERVQYDSEKTVAAMTDVELHYHIRRAMKEIGWGDKHVVIDRQPDGSAYLTIAELDIPLGDEA